MTKKTPHSGWASLTKPVADEPPAQPEPPTAIPVSGWIPLSEVRLETVSWLWEPWVPKGKLVVIEGDPGTCKSTLTTWIAAGITRGEWGPPSNVLLANLEDTAGDTILPRFLANGGDVRRVQIRDIDKGLRIPQDVPALVRMVAASKVGVVVIDPLMAALQGDSHRDQDVRQSLAPLTAMAADYGVAVVLVRHLRKGGGPAMYAGGGSIGITGAARAVMRVAVHPEDPDMRVLAMVKTNLGPLPPSQVFQVIYDGDIRGRVDWHGDTPFTAGDLDTYQRVNRGRGTDKRATAVAFLRAELADGPVLVSELRERADAAGLTWATVRRADTAVGITKKKSAFNGPWEWSLSEDSQG
jgi:hypothetical protein